MSGSDGAPAAPSMSADGSSGSVSRRSGVTPLLKKLTLLRRKATAEVPHAREGDHLGYEATEELETVANAVDTPIGPHEGVQLAEDLRHPDPARGPRHGRADADLLPNADVHHIGMYRSRHSLLPIQYYNKLPRQASLCSEVAFVLDPMIAAARRSRRSSRS